MSRSTWRALLLALGAAAWIACFSILARRGTWLPFAFFGPGLAALALATDAGTRALLRPTRRAIAAGVVGGALMALATHAAFAAAAALAPPLRAETLELFALLRVEGVSPAARAALILVIAASEEIVFRGALAGPPTAGASSHRGIGRGAVLRIVALAVLYALTMAPLGSPLLVACALGCGIVWGLMRVAARSLVVPVLAHVLWDLILLVLWPLV